MSGDPLLSAVADLIDDVNRDHRLPWHDDPAAFARECVAWPADTELAPYQATTLDDLAEHHRIAVRSLHGVGKTTTAALAVLWFATTRDAAGIDWKCVTTAGAWRQLERYLWSEIKLWARRIRWDLLNRGPLSETTELLTLMLKLTHGQAFAVASDDPGLIEGAHAAEILYVFDESKSISAETFDAAEGAFSTGTAYALAQSTPGLPSGRFHAIHARRPGFEDWRTRHVTLSDAIAAGRVNPEWAEQRRRQWGDGSAIYQNRVLGNFATSDEDSVIPLAWIEGAVERWHAWDDAGRPQPVAPLVLGVDIARSGADKTVLASRRGSVVTGLERFRLSDTMETTGHVAGKLTETGSMAIVDVIGIGAGVLDRLREQNFTAVAFNASGRSDRRDRSGELPFLNKRAEAWWLLREALDPSFGSEIALPDDDELVGDLTSPTWKLTSAGKLQVEAKDDIKRRLGRSPDAGDAVVMAFSAAGAVGTITVARYEGMPRFDWTRDDVWPALDDEMAGLPMPSPFEPGTFHSAGQRPDPWRSW